MCFYYTWLPNIRMYRKRYIMRYHYWLQQVHLLLLNIYTKPHICTRVYLKLTGKIAQILLYKLISYRIVLICFVFSRLLPTAPCIARVLESEVEYDNYRLPSGVIYFNDIFFVIFIKYIKKI